jgi:hypothetical protein
MATLHQMGVHKLLTIMGMWGYQTSHGCVMAVVELVRKAIEYKQAATKDQIRHVDLGKKTVLKDSIKHNPPLSNVFNVLSLPSYEPIKYRVEVTLSTR